MMRDSQPSMLNVACALDGPFEVHRILIVCSPEASYVLHAVISSLLEPFGPR